MDLGHAFSGIPANIERPRDELLAQVSRYRQDKRASHATTDEDYALLYAYSKIPEEHILQNHVCYDCLSLLTSHSHREPPIVERDSSNFDGVG